MAWRPSERKIYRTLLLAYPAEFRYEYAPQMESLAEERLASEPRFRVWASLVADVFIAAPAEHLHILARDLRHSLRLLRKAPGFTAIALLALALGVGASVTIFSLIDAVLLRSLPFGRPEQLVYMWTPLPRYAALPRELGPSFADVLAWRGMSQSFDAITAVKQRMLTVDAGNGPQRVGATFVLGNFFQTIDAAPILGRTVLPSDDRPGQPRVAVISDHLWQSQWNRDPAAIGRAIRVGQDQYSVIGIMPSNFGYPHEHDYPFAPAGLKHTDLWIPAALTPQQEADRLRSCDAAVGRLRPGASLARAQAEMSAIQARLDPLNLPEMRGSQSLLVPFLETTIGPIRPLMRLLAGAVFLVLLIACGNVASLLLARGLSRVHEMGVRTALGASRARLVRQLITESLLLSAVGGICGALLSVAAVRTLARLNPGDIPRFDEISVDARVLGFALAISIASGVLFGVLPALAASRVHVSELLRLGGRGAANSRSRSRYVLIVADVALATVLLAGAGLLIRSYLRVQSEDKGFAPATLTATLALDGPRPPDAELPKIGRRIVTRLAALPDVLNAGGTNALPLSHHESFSTFRIDGYPNRPGQTANARTCAGEFLQTMQTPLIAGRLFTAADTRESAIVSQSFARTYFPKGNALGGRIQRGPPSDRWATIVGIVADVRHSNLEKTPEPTLYELSWAVEAVAIRTALPPESLISAVRAAVREVAPSFVVSDIQTMRQRTSESAARRVFQTVLLVTFASIAVFLALVGLHGLLAYSVRQRAAEIGVRIALGADRATVIAMVVRQGILLTASGLALGLLAAAALGRWVATLLYGVRAIDPITFVAVPVFLLAASLFASLVPAWRAARIDPVASLRS